MSVTFVSELQIEAPVDQAWGLLAELDSYSVWNRFTPRVYGTLQPGRRLLLLARVGPFLFPQLERVEVVEPGREIRWGFRWPLGSLSGSRYQRLESTERGCRYSTGESFQGWLAPALERLAGATVQRGLDTVGGCLKQSAEGGLS
jgi:hypothetical protein